MSNGRAAHSSLDRLLIRPGPEPLKGVWVIAGDGNREWLGRVMRRQDGKPVPWEDGSEENLTDVARLTLSPAYEWKADTLMAIPPDSPQRVAIPIGRAHYALPLEWHSEPSMIHVRPTSILPIVGERFRRMIAEEVATAEKAKRRLAEDEGAPPIVTEPAEVRG